jgi:ATP/maltotriose-dependent transcriptional regulator MalT
MRAVAPELGARSLALLRAPGIDLTSEMLPVPVQELGRIQEPLVLALDDYHQLEGDEVHATMRRLLDYLPDGVCIAIASRTEPAVAVARLRVRGQLVEVDADELRFSVAETRALLNDLLGLAAVGQGCRSAPRARRGLAGRHQSRCVFAAQPGGPPRVHRAVRW